MGTSSQSIEVDGTVTTSHADDLDSFQEQDSSMDDTEDSSDSIFSEKDDVDDKIENNNMSNGSDGMTM